MEDEDKDDEDEEPEVGEFDGVSFSMTGPLTTLLEEVVVVVAVEDNEDDDEVRAFFRVFFSSQGFLLQSVTAREHEAQE